MQRTIKIMLPIECLKLPNRFYFYPHVIHPRLLLSTINITHNSTNIYGGKKDLECEERKEHD